MPEYLTPGVYVEELPAPQTIEGVSTSDAGFVGAARRGGVVGLPQLVTSFSDFVRKYGEALPAEPWGDARFLGFAVEGFFNNGGQRAYIARVVGPGAAASTRTYSDGFNTTLAADTTTDPGDRDVVRLASLVGVQVGSRLTFTERIAGTVQADERRVVGYDAGTGIVRLDSPLDFRFTAAKCAVTLAGIHAPDGTAAGPSLTVEARDPGAWGDGLDVLPMVTHGAAGLTAAAAVAAETTFRRAALTFTGTGPAAGDTSVAVDAGSAGGFADDTGWVVFDNGVGGAGNHRELREVTVDGTTLRWDRPLAHDYTGGPATGERLTDVLAVPDPGPAIALDADVTDGDATFDLTDASSVAEGDVIELRDDTTGAVDILVVDSIASDTITPFDAVDGDFAAASTTATLYPSARATVASATGLSAGDLVRVRQGAATQVLHVAEVDGSDLVFNMATHPLQQGYDAPSDDTADPVRDGATLELAIAGSDGGLGLDVRSASNFYENAVVEIDDGYQKSYHTVDGITGNTLTLAAPLADDVPGGAAVRVVELTLVVDDGAATERFDGLSLNPAADRYAPNVVNLQSRFVRVTDEGSTQAAPFGFPQVDWAERNAEPATDPTQLGGGADGNPPTANDYLGQDLGPGQRSGIAALADIDAVAILGAPGASDPIVQGALLGQCEARKDRFAVLDPAVGSDIGSGGPDDILVQRSNHDSLYGAIYYPWIRVRDPLDSQNTEGVLVPPSGHVMGIYARVDTERGVHKAPANEVIRGATDLEVKLSDREQAVLNPANVNALRDFRDALRGLRVWGARVVTSDNAWKYVPVRRLFIFVEESLYKGLQWVVFEPNADPLWAKVRRTVSGFLRRVWLDGALEGLTEEEAFFVKCDLSTMTQDDIDNGRLIVLVGIAPVKPAEFVIIRITQKTREAAG